MPRAPISITRYNAGHAESSEDELAIEEPLEIRVRGRAISVTMRTPGHDLELAAGFCLAENIIRRPADILRIEPCPRDEFGNRVDVILAPDVHVDFDRLTRHVFASSSCGVCGKATLDSVRNTFPPITSDLQVSPETLTKLPLLMRAAQATFARTGGLHAAALFDSTGQLLALREDVGRHNAVDKILGFALTNNLPAPSQAQGFQSPGPELKWSPDHHILLVSGRASFELVQKALAARIPILAAVSAPSSLAVDLARESNQTLIGFLRDQRMNVYTHAHRIKAGT